MRVLHQRCHAIEQTSVFSKILWTRITRGGCQLYKRPNDFGVDENGSEIGTHGPKMVYQAGEEMTETLT